MLEATDLRSTIRYYCDVLGFVKGGVYPDAESPEWVRLQRDSIEIMYTGRNIHHRHLPTTLTGTLYCYVDDVETLWEEWQHTVEVAWRLETFDYGMREFGIRDCNNYVLSFGQESHVDEG